MKYILLALASLLVGCGTLPSDSMLLGGDMLDTAPKGSQELRYPEWGNATTPAKASVKGSMGQSRTNSYHALQSFLVKNGVDYEVLPGNHVMVKLKDTIKFNTGSANVAPESSYWLDMMGRYLANEPGIDIVIDGHTDSTGGQKLNDSLSIKRAQAVKQTLVSNNVSMNAIFYPRLWRVCSCMYQ